MPSLPRLIASSALAWMLVFQPAYAHEAWASRVILIQYGDIGGDHLDTYHPDRISGLAAIDASGIAVAVRPVSIGEAGVVVDAGATDPAAVFFAMAFDHYLVDGEQWTKITAEEAAQAKDAKTWTGSYTATSIFTWTDALTAGRDRSIELVPQTDPTILAAGTDLPLLALREGKPAPGITVELGNDRKVISDAEGRLTVPVTGGHQIIIGGIETVTDGHTVYAGAVLSFTARSANPK